MDSDLNNQNDQWKLNLDIDDSDIRLTHVLRPYGEEGCVMSTQEYMKEVVEDVGRDKDFKYGLWVSATDYVNSNGGISCSSNVIIDLTVTLKDLSVTIPGTIHHKVIDESGYGKDITVGVALILDNVSIFSPKPLMHYLNITIRNVVKVFRKDTVSESGSGVGGSGMLMEEEEIAKLMDEEEMADLDLQVCRNVTDQEMADEEALNLVLDEEARQARAEHEWLEKCRQEEELDEEHETKL
ncbi:hypothetical protein Tco_1001433 [Tanacetum coccineum]